MAWTVSTSPVHVTFHVSCARKKTQLKRGKLGVAQEGTDREFQAQKLIIYDY
jgi:hypothetical protein